MTKTIILIISTISFSSTLFASDIDLSNKNKNGSLFQKSNIVITNNEDSNKNLKLVCYPFCENNEVLKKKVKKDKVKSMKL